MGEFHEVTTKPVEIMEFPEEAVKSITDSIALWDDLDSQIKALLEQKRQINRFKKAENFLLTCCDYLINVCHIHEISQRKLYGVQSACTYFKTREKVQQQKGWIIGTIEKLEFSTKGMTINEVIAERNRTNRLHIMQTSSIADSLYEQFYAIGESLVFSDSPDREKMYKMAKVLLRVRFDYIQPYAENVIRLVKAENEVL